MLLILLQKLCHVMVDVVAVVAGVGCGALRTDSYGPIMAHSL